jgi:hypothetical protein
MTGKRRPLWRRLLDGWLAVAGRFGEVQTLMVLAVIYALVMGPFALGAALARRDFLAKRGLGESGSAWSAAENGAPELEKLRHPF